MKTMRIRRSGFFLLISLSLYYSLTYAQNYDETKVGAYSLPPLFKNSELSDKKLLKNWKNKRREETLHLFEENIYGQMPKTYDSIQYQITNENQLAMNGNATLKQVDIEVFNHKNSVTIHLVLFEPNSIAKAPVFLLINHRGTQLTDATRKTKSDFWPAELLIDRGYAIATFQVNDVAPDNVLHYKKGVLQLYPEQLTAKDGMRAIGAWAWGIIPLQNWTIV